MIIRISKVCVTINQSLELLMKKKEEIPTPQKILKVETKICAIWSILEANLKKSSTLKYMTSISFVLSICIHRSIILIFIEKKYACWFVDFSPTQNMFFHNVWFSFPWKSSFPWQIPGSDKCIQIWMGQSSYSHLIWDIKLLTQA